MRKILLACFSIALLSAALTGCRASGEIDPDGNVSHQGVLPR